MKATTVEAKIEWVKEIRRIVFEWRRDHINEIKSETFSTFIIT